MTMFIKMEKYFEKNYMINQVVKKEKLVILIVQNSFLFILLNYWQFLFACRLKLELTTKWKPNRVSIFSWCNIIIVFVYSAYLSILKIFNNASQNINIARSLLLKLHMLIFWISVFFYLHIFWFKSIWSMLKYNKHVNIE